MNPKHRLTLILILIVFTKSVLFAQSGKQKSFNLGVVETFYSKELQENRTLNIYLPEGYSPDSAQTYPVIYLLDGSADEDFIHVAGLVQYCNFSWIEILPKSIVVGISNIDRRRDFTFPTNNKKDKLNNPTSGSSAQFIRFIEHDLQPFINKYYKTNNSKMLIGQSLGGLLATEILFKKPNLFNQYVIVSPSLWWDDESLLKIERQVIQPQTKVFIAVGKEGEIMENDAKSLYK